MAWGDALCPALQLSLNNVAGQSSSVLTRTNVGFLQMLKSEYNTNGFQMIPTQNRQGGIQSVDILYNKPMLAASVVNAKPAVCDGITDYEPYRQTINPADFNQVWTPAYRLSKEDLANLCYADADAYRANFINGLLDGLLQAIDTQLLTIQQANWGDFFNGTDAAVAADILNADGSARPQGWSTVTKALTRIRFTGKPMVVGMGEPGIFEFADLIKIGCCNDTGIDVSRVGDKFYYFADPNVDLVWTTNANTFGVFIPGSTQLLTFNEYKRGTFREEIVPGVKEFTTITDPVTGQDFDIKLVQDDCTETYKITVGARFFLWNIPDDTYEATDPMNGVNGTLRFYAT